MLEIRQNDLPHPESALLKRWLLLGPEYEQIILDVRRGPLAPQVSRLTDIPLAEIALNSQRHVFGDVCVFMESQSLAHCSQPSYTLFFDCRTLGIPICSRVIAKLEFRVEELLQMVGARVPLNLTIFVSGGMESPEADDIIVCEHRASLVFWAAPTPNSPQHPVSPDDDEQDFIDDSTPDRSSDVDTGNALKDRGPEVREGSKAALTEQMVGGSAEVVSLPVAKLDCRRFFWYFQRHADASLGCATKVRSPGL